MRPLATDTLLLAWESGRKRHPVDRALMLFALARPDADPEYLADEPLGKLNQALIALRQTSFGSELRACVDCPACGERLEFTLDAGALLALGSHTETAVEVQGMNFRLPTSRDMARLAAGQSEFAEGGSRNNVESAALCLMRLCRLPDQLNDDETLSESLIEPLEAAFESADPCAGLALDFDCEACGHAWTAPFDIGAFLWEEIEAGARHLLDQVHLLASAYGWSERDILAMPDSRRAFYLERVTA